MKKTHTNTSRINTFIFCIKHKNPNEVSDIPNRFGDIRALHFSRNRTYVRHPCWSCLIRYMNNLLVEDRFLYLPSFMYGAIGLSLLAAHNCPDSLCLKDWISYPGLQRLCIDCVMSLPFCH